MDAIRLIEDLVGKKAQTEHQPRHPADVMATWANIGKSEQFLRWRPVTTFKIGITQLVQWYKDNREWARNVSTD